MKNNNKVTPVYAAFVIALILAVILRVIQLATGFDFETGFFKNHASPLVILFYILCVAGVTGLVICEKLAYGKSPRMKDMKTGPLNGIGQAVLAGVLIFISKDGIKEFFEVRKTASGLKETSALLGGYVNILMPLFGILSALIFIIHAFSAFTGRHFEKKIPVASLLPTFWALLNVIQCFSYTASYLRQSELFVELFAYTLSMIAFLGYARHLCDIGLKDSGFYYIPAVLGSIAFSLMAVIYSLFAGKAEKSVVFIGLIVFFGLAVVRSGRSDTKEAEQTEEAAA